MKKENWNPNDWQGKRKDQLEYSYKVVFYSTIVIFCVIIIEFLSK